jgi:hypothetical protein
MNPVLALNSEQFTAAAMPIGIMLSLLTIIVLAMRHKHERRRLWHETARIALEKGQPLPPPEEGHHSASRGSGHDFRVGLILMAIGGAAYLSTEDKDKIILAALPGFIGLAMVINGVLDRVFRQPRP